MYVNVCKCRPDVLCISTTFCFATGLCTHRSLFKVSTHLYSSSFSLLPSTSCGHLSLSLISFSLRLSLSVHLFLFSLHPSLFLFISLSLRLLVFIFLVSLSFLYLFRILTSKAFATYTRDLNHFCSDVWSTSGWIFIILFISSFIKNQ